MLIWLAPPKLQAAPERCASLGAPRALWQELARRGCARHNAHPAQRASSGTPKADALDR